MNKLAHNKSARFQNISTMMVSVMKGDKNVTLKPSQVVSLTGADVQQTIDNHIDPEKNPFDLGFVVQIPQGKQVHPDAPKFAPKVRGEKVQSLLSEGSIADITKAIKTISDMGAITMWNRLLAEAEGKIPDSKHAKVERLLEDQSADISRMIDRNREKYEKALN